MLRNSCGNIGADFKALGVDCQVGIEAVGVDGFKGYGNTADDIFGKLAVGTKGRGSAECLKVPAETPVVAVDAGYLAPGIPECRFDQIPARCYWNFILRLQTSGGQQLFPGAECLCIVSLCLLG